MGMKKKKSGGGGASWMDTYGDMVTLLMCFFVLLFSMSTMDKQKVIELIQAFNPAALQTPEHYGGEGGDVGNPPTTTQGEVDQALENLYESLSEYISNTQSSAEDSSEGSVSEGSAASDSSGQGMAVTRGDGFVYIALNSAVFFEGDDFRLLPSGEEALDAVSEMLATQADYIDELRVLGHTAQERADKPNDYSFDRDLAGRRSSIVAYYIQDKGFLDPARIVSVGYGQWRPVASNDTPEGRAQNRRVEIIVSGLNVDAPEEDTVAKYYTERGTENPHPDGMQGQPEDQTADGTATGTPAADATGTPADGVGEAE